ncbi:MAG: polysaccharide biosynthesis/export family protein [Terracidiphilus sp.]
MFLALAWAAEQGNAQTQTGGAASSGGASSKVSVVGGQSMGPTIVPKDISQLLIEPGDLLSVNVYDTPELSGSFRVDQNGDLTIPLCGKVNLRGLTLQEAARHLEAALKDGQILTQPQVNIDVVQYAGQYVTVMGEVVSPGRVPLIAPTLLGDVLAEAGGETPAAGARVRIRHGSGEGQMEQEVPYARSLNNSESASILVRPGDAVIVPRAGIVYVLGAVNRPGGYVMQEDGKLNVAEALAMSGGTVLQANTGGLRVIRRNPDGTVLDFPLSYNAITKGTQTPLQLQAEDIVYVPMSKVKATFSTATGILSAAASAAIVTR